MFFDVVRRVAQLAKRAGMLLGPGSGTFVFVPSFIFTARVFVRDFTSPSSTPPPLQDTSSQDQLMGKKEIYGDSVNIARVAC